jgi:hypothetical protein
LRACTHCSHDFEQHKKWENSASQDRQCSKPQGQRFAASAEWKQQHQRRRSQQAAEEDEKQVRPAADAACMLSSTAFSMKEAATKGVLI